MNSGTRSFAYYNRHKFVCEIKIIFIWLQPKELKCILIAYILLFNVSAA